jgi:hypothetical protein
MNRGTLKPELIGLTLRNGPFGTNAGRAVLSVGHRSRYRRRWRGWHDEAIVLPREWSSTDPDGLHQQPVLVPSLWGGSGPRHPRDAQFARRDADAISTSRAGLIAWLLSRTVTPCLAWRPGHEATASSPVAQHGVRIGTGLSACGVHAWLPVHTPMCGGHGSRWPLTATAHPPFSPLIVRRRSSRGSAR